MDKEAFEALFNEHVNSRLARLGFVSEGKSLIFHDQCVTVSLFRLGGRLSVPGSISQILCFRHSFLRDMKETVPAKAVSDIQSYPYKFKPLEDARAELVYRPQNLNYDYDRLRWEGVDERSVCEKLDLIVANIEDRVVPWAKSLPLAAAKSELERHGENAWCERMWIEDYAARLMHN